MKLTLKNQDGTDSLLELRKVPLKDLGLLAGESSDETKACLCIAPEGRTPEEVRAVFDALDDESQFEVWAQGLELNEENLRRFSERRKKLAEAGGVNVEAMVERMMASKMEELVGSRLSSEKDIGGETSPKSTPATSSST